MIANLDDIKRRTDCPIILEYRDGFWFISGDGNRIVGLTNEDTARRIYTNARDRWIAKQDRA